MDAPHTTQPTPARRRADCWLVRIPRRCPTPAPARWASRLFFIVVRGTLIGALSAALASAPVSAVSRTPTSPPMLVSPANNRDHVRPAVAVDALGNLVVVWQGSDASTGNYEIFARLYDAGGAPRGDPFRVNQTTTGNQRRPSVAIDRNGGFLIAWDGAGASDTQGIYARYFSHDGTPRTGELAMNLTTAGSQFDPALAIDPNGNLVIAWHGMVAGDDGGVVFRRFDPNGVPRSPSEERPYDEATAAAGDQVDPALAIDGEGNFAIAWETYRYDLGSGAPPTAAVTARRAVIERIFMIPP